MSAQNQKTDSAHIIYSSYYKMDYISESHELPYLINSNFPFQSIRLLADSQGHWTLRLIRHMKTNSFQKKLTI